MRIIICERTREMYRGGGGSEDQQAYVEVNSDSEQQPAMGDNAAAAMDDDELQHLHKDMFAKAQKALIDIDVTMSPAELQSSVGASNVWKLMPHLAKELKQNLALKNRNMATGDQVSETRASGFHQLIFFPNSLPAT